MPAPTIPPTTAEWAAVARDGRRFLLARVADLTARRLNGPARIHDLDTGRLHDLDNLQIAFKWAEWKDTTPAAYQAEQAK